MGQIADATYTGASGTKYSFGAYTLDTIFNNVGAVYIFSNRTVTGNKGIHEFLYIGQTGELADRLNNHKKWSCVQRNGVNCICVLTEDKESVRLDIETDLIRNNATPCND